MVRTPYHQSFIPKEKLDVVQGEVIWRRCEHGGGG